MVTEHSKSKEVKKGAKGDVGNKLRIRVRAYDHKILDASVKQIIDTAVRFDATILGPIPLPTHRRVFTVLRSTFVNKKAREQFELCSYKRLLDIYSSTAKTIDALMKLELPSGVEVEIKV